MDTMLYSVIVNPDIDDVNEQGNAAIVFTQQTWAEVTEIITSLRVFAKDDQILTVEILRTPYTIPKG